MVITVSLLNLLLIWAPNFPPNHAPGIKSNANSQLTFPKEMCVTALTILAKKTTIIDVGMAIYDGNENNKIKAGTSIEPPPIPNRPEMKPTKKEIIIEIGRASCRERG